MNGESSLTKPLWLAIYLSLQRPQHIKAYTLIHAAPCCSLPRNQGTSFFKIVIKMNLPVPLKKLKSHEHRYIEQLYGEKICFEAVAKGYIRKVTFKS